MLSHNIQCGCYGIQGKESGNLKGEAGRCTHCSFHFTSQTITVIKGSIEAISGFTVINKIPDNI